MAVQSQNFLEFRVLPIPKLLTHLQSVDREIDLEDVQDYAASSDFAGRTAELTWMNQQLFNVLAQKTRGNLFQTVKKMSEDEGCCGAGAWVKLLRAYKGQERKQESETHWASP